MEVGCKRVPDVVVHTGDITHNGYENEFHLAFQRLKKREGFYKALKVSLIYIFNTKSLQQDHKYQLPNPPADLFHPSEILRLTKAFIKKTNDENLYCAFKISFWYIFNREKLTLQTSKSEFFYQNRDIYLNY